MRPLVMIDGNTLQSTFQKPVPFASFLVDGIWISLKDVSFRNGYGQITGHTYDGTCQHGECLLSASQISACIIP